MFLGAILLDMVGHITIFELNFAEKQDIRVHEREFLLEMKFVGILSVELCFLISNFSILSLILT